MVGILLCGFKSPGRKRNENSIDLIATLSKDAIVIKDVGFIFCMYKIYAGTEKGHAELEVYRSKIRWAMRKKDEKKNK